MNKGKHVVAMLSVLSLGLWITGCASFGRQRVPEAGQLPPPADVSQAVKASYQFTSGAKVFGGRNEHPQSIRLQLEKEFVDQLRESGYFATVSPDRGEGIHISADLLNYGSGASAIIGGVIGGLSLTTIPCWATDNFKVTAKVATADGRQFEYVLDDAMTTVIWLPLIVATPFKHPNGVSTEVRKNLYKNLILRMQQDGLLPISGKHQLKSRLELTVAFQPMS